MIELTMPMAMAYEILPPLKNVQVLMFAKALAMIIFHWLFLSQFPNVIFHLRMPLL